MSCVQNALLFRPTEDRGTFKKRTAAPDFCAREEMARGQVHVIH